MPNRASMLDDLDVMAYVARRLRALEGQHHQRTCKLVETGLASSEGCWCRNGGPDGETLPCPPKDSIE